MARGCASAGLALVGLVSRVDVSASLSRYKGGAVEWGRKVGVVGNKLRRRSSIETCPVRSPAKLERV